MSVLIKDMEKPKYCYAVIDGESEYCPFVNTDDDCVILLKKGICEGSWEEQYSKCPLVEEPERLTDDDFETIRIHLNAQKEKLCNQQRWEEAEEYRRIIDRFMAFASAQPEIIRCGQCKYAEAADSEDNQDGYTCQFHRGSIWFSGSYCSWAERREECTP